MAFMSQENKKAKAEKMKPLLIDPFPCCLSRDKWLGKRPRPPSTKEAAMPNIKKFTDMTVGEIAGFIRCMDGLCSQLNDIQANKRLASGNLFPLDQFTWVARQKFASLDYGKMGAWLVEKTTGEIFNIKSYGTADYNKKKKSDIGNIYTVTAERLHSMRWNYLW